MELKQETAPVAINTDQELWRESEDFYSPSIHVTESGLIGINVGGTVVLKRLEDWHDLALTGGWINARINPPTESGRYWCIVAEQGGLGLSHYQWNCGYNSGDKMWSEGKDVIYWKPLAQFPHLINR